MGRRSFISITSINRIISASNRLKREKYNNELIQAQNGNKKEKPPEFSILNVDFNINTRVTRIEFLQTQEYRTIQRYITQNYERYPIYSEWKTREKTIKKTIKLTNSELELLNVNKDELIKMFAEDIILALNNEELFPSWFIKLYLKRELDSDLNEMSNKLKYLNTKQNNKITLEQEEINAYNDKIIISNKSLHKLLKIKNKKDILLNKISNAKHNIIKTIFSIGIYDYLISQKRKHKVELKLEKINNRIKTTNDQLDDYKASINNCNSIISNCKLTIASNEKKYNIEKNNRLNEFNTKISEVKPLPNIISQKDSFTMLKLFSGLEYEKIIGVYIIHNKEKDKYYVGQSKDVMKRIKQHFNGTVPKNPIFAEDYYTSKINNKEDLFEIKIIKCNTKDELDKQEKKLIYEYDSWNNGYNGTSGNI